MSLSIALSLHLLAAVAWIGGMVFLSLVLLPVLRRESGLTGERQRLFQEAARRFRWLVWPSVAVLLVTGPVLLSGRADTLAKAGSWALLFKLKLALVAVLILLTALHDFWLGPLRATRQSSSPGTGRAWAGGLGRVVPWMARAGLLVGLLVVVLGAALVKA